MNRPRGFALIAVLWVVVALTALAANAVGRARADAGVSGDAVAKLRGRWAAEGCFEVARSRLETSLRATQAMIAPPADTLFFANGARCVAESFDPGARVNRDSLGPEELAHLDSALSAAGISPGSRDSFFTTYGSGRLNVNAAPPVLLATLPGIGAEALRAIAGAREWRRPPASLDALVLMLSPAARAGVLQHYAELSTRTSFRTEALAVTARGWVEGARAVATIEILVVNGGTRAALVRRRMW